MPDRHKELGPLEVSGAAADYYNAIKDEMSLCCRDLGKNVFVGAWRNSDLDAWNVRFRLHKGSVWFISSFCVYDEDIIRDGLVSAVTKDAAPEAIVSLIEMGAYEYAEP